MVEPATPEENQTRLARPADLPLLREIELAAGVVFADIGMESVAEAEPPPVSELAMYEQGDRCWVTVDAQDRAIAYIIVEEVDGCCHIEQVSVHPEAARRGVGRRLLDIAEQWAIDHELDALTLTTFVDVAWNGPYYERCGFRFLAESEETPGLRTIRAHEAELGLDRWGRACMRRELKAKTS